jgi:Tfp pilus assembly protein PilF
MSYVAQWIEQQDQEPQALELAVERAQQAVALSDSTFWSHGVMSFVYLWQKRNAEALAEGEQAATLNPDDAQGHASVGNVLNYTGRPADTVTMLEQLSCHDSFFSHLMP